MLQELVAHMDRQLKDIGNELRQLLGEEERDATAKVTIPELVAFKVDVLKAKIAEVRGGSGGTLRSDRRATWGL